MWRLLSLLISVLTALLAEANGIIFENNNITNGLPKPLNQAFYPRKPRLANSGADMTGWTPGEACDRKCDGQTRTCYFEFHVEDYVILSPACRNCSNGVKSDCLFPQCVPTDGVIRPILTVNRAIPGTPIVVCHKDQIVVDLINQMEDITITIHWHGLRQKGTPYMDGVPMVGQCPIPPQNTFRYDFNAEEAGTYFWHSHIGPQKLDGLQGALIVREVPSKDPYSSLYDEDLTAHVIFVQDWLHVDSHHWTPGPHLPKSLQLPDSVLINGIGPLSYQKANNFIPMAEFTVESGKRYRFRVISATCMICTFALKIQSHHLTVITGDGGRRFEPFTVDSIGFNTADRFDFILYANQTPSDYYIFVQNLEPICHDIRQIAVLHYAGSNSQLTLPAPPTGEVGTILNDPTSLCDSSMPNQICMDQVVGVKNVPSVQGSNAEYMQIPIAWGVYLYNVDDLFAPGSYQHYEEAQWNRLIRYTVNNISFNEPPSPLSSQFDDIPPGSFCSNECHSSEIQKSCYCTNVYTIPTNATVDMIVYDQETRPAGFNHAFHLHGYNFYILKMGVFPNENKNVNEREKIVQELLASARNDRLNLKSRAQKDSITTPAGGYVLLRFVADNPGFWFVHCHFLYHHLSGMAAVFHVGPDIPKAPPNFPKCGNYYGG